MEIYPPTFMDHYDTLWGLVIYGTGNGYSGVDAKTAAKTSECSKLFYQLSISSDMAKCYWKSGVVKYFNHYYSQDLLSKVDKTFKELFYSYLFKVNEITNRFVPSLNHPWVTYSDRLEIHSLFNPLKDYLSETYANKHAQFFLGYCLEHLNVKSDLEEIIKYYTLSADQGLLEAQRGLASFYDNRGEHLNAELCFKYYKLALDQQIKNFSAKLKIDPFAGMGMSRRVNLKDAFAHYKSVINWEVNCDEKMLMIAARCHEEGIGTAVNVKKALMYYKAVKEQAFTVSSTPLAKVITCYEHGIGTPKNLKEAIKYYKVWIKHPYIS